MNRKDTKVMDLEEITVSNDGIFRDRKNRKLSGPVPDGDPIAILVPFGPLRSEQTVAAINDYGTSLCKEATAYSVSTMPIGINTTDEYGNPNPNRQFVIAVQYWRK